MVKDINQQSSPSGEENKLETRQKKSKNTKSSKRNKSQKRISDKDIDKSETGIENCLQVIKINNQLEHVAAKNNLTDANVRNILKRVVSNEHVLAIVKLKESEQVDDGTDSENNPLNITPLTRSKVKELQQKDLPGLWPIPVVSPVQPATSEVAVLINEELPDDSSDEEYNPEDENISDDEKERAAKSTKNKNVQSQVSDVSKDECRTNLTDDGLFKIPQVNSSEDETIALRTRSKLCLSSTNIETIEKAFIPPDITSDMYDCDDIDGVWKDFLNKFTEPLPQHQEDDEETDPEYSAQIDEIPVDKEELREDPEVTVTKRELSDLVAELLDMNSLSGMDFLCNTIESQEQVGYQYVPNNNDLNSGDINSKPGNMLNEENVLKMKSKSIEVEVIDDLNSNSSDSIMTSTQKLILAQQLRQHVQLCTQHFLQLYGHPELWALADMCKQNLIQILSLSENNHQTAFFTHNLKPAVELCEYWENRLSNDNEETRGIFQFIKNEINKSRANKLSHNRYYSQFPPQMMDVVCDSKVFIYPELLPQIPFRSDLSNGGIKELTPSEQHVIAIELYLFYKYMQNNPQLYKQGKKRSYTVSGVAQLIEKYLRNGRSAQTIARQIRKRLVKTARDNPIKYYFKNNVPPPTEHILLPFDPDLILPPRKQPLDLLHHIWKTHILKPTLEIRRKDTPCFVKKHITLTPSKKGKTLNSDNIFNIEISQSFNENILTTSENHTTQNNPNIVEKSSFGSENEKTHLPIMQINIETNETILPTICNESTLQASNSLPILYTSPISKKTNLKENCTSPSIPRKSSHSAALVTYISTPLNSLILTTIQNSTRNTTNSLGFQISDQISPISKDDAIESDVHIKLTNDETLPCDCRNSSIKDNSLTGQKLLTDYFTPCKSKDVMKDVNNSKHCENQVICKLKLYIQTYFKSVLHNLFLIYNVNQTEKCVKKAFIHILMLDYFFSIYFPKILPLMSNFMISQEFDNKSLSFTSSEDIVNDCMSEEDENCSKENCNLEKTSLADTNTEYDINNVNKYYASVKKNFNGKKSGYLDKFHEIVISINADNKPSEVYKKLELIFLPDYPDLLEQFLQLLLPRKAEKIFKFIEILLNSDINKFEEMVTSYLFDHSMQIKKIYIALSELSDIPDISMCDVISSVLPLLKGNTVLRKWFLQLFPYEILSESDIIDHRHIDLTKTFSLANSDNNITQDENDITYGGNNCKCKCHSFEEEKYKTNLHCIPCGMKYIQEKILRQPNINKHIENKNYTSQMAILENENSTVTGAETVKRRMNNNPMPQSANHVDVSDLSYIGSDADKYIEKTPKKKIKLFKNSRNKESNKQIDTNCFIPVKNDIKRNCSSNIPKTRSSSNIQVNICDSTETYCVTRKVESNTDNDILQRSSSSCDHVSSSDGFNNSDSDVSLTFDSNVINMGDDNKKLTKKNQFSDKKNFFSPFKNKNSFSDDNKSNLEKRDTVNNTVCDMEEAQASCVNNWTRDEDKIILQLLQSQLEFDLNIQNISKLLPNKKLSDIKCRSQMLLNFLQKMV